MSNCGKWAKELGELVSPNRPIVYGILMPGYGHPGGIPVIKVKDIKDGQIDRSNLLLTSPEIDFQYRRSKVQSGDLLFTIRGTVGRTAFVPRTLEGANITQDTARIGVIGSDPRFVRGYLAMPLPKQFASIHTLGVAVQGINLGEVRRTPIAVPPILEQEKVSEIVDSIERKIEQEKATLLKVSLTKCGLMQDLLTGKVPVKVDDPQLEEQIEEACNG